MAAADVYLEYLGSLVMPAAAAISSALTVAARDVLIVEVDSLGTAATFHSIALTFTNNTGTAHAYRVMTWAAGGTVITDTPVTSAAAIEIADQDATNANGAVSVFYIVNPLSAPKLGLGNPHQRTSVVGTSPDFRMEQFEYADSTLQITQLALMSDDGVTNLNAGSSIKVFGFNIS